MKVFKFLLFAAFAANLTACGGGTNSILKNIKVTTTVDANQNQWVDMDATLGMGKMVFPSVTIPVVDPKRPGVVLGEIALQSTLEGQNAISASLNLTAVAGSRLAQDNLLPNGTQIPVAGLTGVVSAKVGDRSKVYIGASQTQMMMGLAIAIPQFDGIAAYIPGVNVFFPIQSSNDVTGLAGVFTGAQSSTSGIGLFFTVPNGGASILPTPTPVMAAMAKAKSASSGAADQIIFKAMNQNTSRGRQLQSELFDMSRHSIQLHVK